MLHFLFQGLLYDYQFVVFSTFTFFTQSSAHLLWKEQILWSLSWRWVVLCLTSSETSWRYFNLIPKGFPKYKMGRTNVLVLVNSIYQVVTHISYHKRTFLVFFSIKLEMKAGTGKISTISTELLDLHLRSCQGSKDKI